MNNDLSQAANSQYGMVNKVAFNRFLNKSVEDIKNNIKPKSKEALLAELSKNETN